MCVWVSQQTMGCGKSRHRSPEDSEIDLKNNSGSKNYNNKNNSSSNKKSSTQNVKKKRIGAAEEKKSNVNEREKEIAEKSPSLKKISNGKTRTKDRNEEIGVPHTPSPKKGGGATQGGAAAATDGAGDKSNGAARSQNKSYLLEVPNEMSKDDSPTKTTCKDFKSLTSSKTVHVTSSQIEFFKMLDEKIEKGGEYLTSGDTSEVSSVDESFRH